MTRRAYINFDVQIEAAGEGHYRVQVLESPAGQAENEFDLVFNPLQLENFYLHMSQSRQGTRDAGGELDPVKVDRTREFGKGLFNSLFGPGVYACFCRSLDAANEQDKGLRIRLRVNAPALAGLPWEFLYDPNVNMFLSRSIDTPIVRYIELPRRDPVLLVKPPLTMLVMISNPRRDLDVEKEWGLLDQALQPLQESGLVRLVRLPRGDLASLQGHLRDDTVHIFHFIGHGDYNERDQTGGLLFENPGRPAAMINGDVLGPLLHNHKSLRLVVLNACEGAVSSPGDPFSGVAQRLVQAGIPAVVAMQFPVSDRSAITFAEQFYGALADGFPVDAALVEARTAISALPNDVEWGTPVLFTRAADGRIFDIQDQSAGQPAAPPPAPSRSAQLELPRQPELSHQPEFARQPGLAPQSGSAAPRGSAGLPEAAPPPPAAQAGSTRSQPSVPLWALGALAGVLLLVFLAFSLGRGRSQPAERAGGAAGSPTPLDTRPAGASTPDAALPGTGPTALPVIPVSLTTDTPTPASRSSDTPQPAASDTPSPAGRASDTPQPAASDTPTLEPATLTPTATPGKALELVDERGAKMRLVPAGRFQMGGKLDVAIAACRKLCATCKCGSVEFGSEAPAHWVELDDFYIDLTEVTNAAYQACVQAGVCQRPLQRSSARQSAYYGNLEFDNYPVIHVTWEMANTFCAWRDARLPSEAEWEKAARGPDGQVYPWGDIFDASRANFCDQGCGSSFANRNFSDGWPEVAPVGSFPDGASPYGVLDMAGNVTEWVQDYYSSNYYNNSPAANPPGPSNGSYRAVRGGSWFYSPDRLRAANRLREKPDTSNYFMGFRCAR